MEQRISLITLGVTDLQRAVDFYEQVVGWKAEPSPPGVVFFDLNGLVFALWPHDELAKDLGMTAGSVPRLPRVFSRSQRPQRGRGRRHFCIFARLRNHRATIVKEPHKTFWGGYSGYFSDPDGHMWEIANNPFWTIRRDGRISMQKE